jgi:hypothetical protein
LVFYDVSVCLSVVGVELSFGLEYIFGGSAKIALKVGCELPFNCLRMFSEKRTLKLHERCLLWHALVGIFDFGIAAPGSGLVRVEQPYQPKKLPRLQL